MTQRLQEQKDNRKNVRQHQSDYDYDIAIQTNMKWGFDPVAVELAFKQLSDLKNLSISPHSNKKDSAKAITVLDDMQEKYHFPRFWPTGEPQNKIDYLTLIDYKLSEKKKLKLDQEFQVIKHFHAGFDYQKIDTRYSRVIVGQSILTALEDEKDISGMIAAVRQNGHKLSRTTIYRWLGTGDDVPALYSTLEILGEYFGQEIKIKKRRAEFVGPRREGEKSSGRQTIILSPLKKKLLKRSKVLENLAPQVLAEMSDANAKQIADNEEEAEAKEEATKRRKDVMQGIKEQTAFENANLLAVIPSHRLIDPSLMDIDCRKTNIVCQCPPQFRNDPGAYAIQITTNELSPAYELDDIAFSSTNLFVKTKDRVFVETMAGEKYYGEIRLDEMEKLVVEEGKNPRKLIFSELLVFNPGEKREKKIDLICNPDARDYVLNEMDSGESGNNHFIPRLMKFMIPLKSKVDFALSQTEPELLELGTNTEVKI